MDGFGGRIALSIYKDCDIRGVYRDELDPASAREIGLALGSMADGPVCLGGDVRISTPELKMALAGGILESGANIDDLGTLPTPAFYFALQRGSYSGGIMVTASHNPARYNGFKFVLGGEPAARETVDEVEHRTRARDYKRGAGVSRSVDVLPAYAEFLRGRFAGAGGASVVIDAGNGCMGETAPFVFSSIGCDVARLFCDFDGRFPGRGPDPADYACLGALQGAVREKRADFGVAFDGDGDRVVFADERGDIVMSERVFALLIRERLKNKPSPVVYDVKASSVVRRAVLEMGGEPIMSRSGHTFVQKMFLGSGAALAGEVSGHFFFRELGHDDGLYAALVLTSILKESGMTLSDLLSEIIPLPITPDIRVDCPYEMQDAWLDRIAALGRGREVIKIDGIRVEFPFGWLLARKSVTVPQISLRIEANDPESMARIKTMLITAAPEIAGLLGRDDF
ncbi:MAG: phosphomannomutase/phosphoglucomutase [Synergistaceae bacterium]|jgi:phosphomannomutase/phosphoglucomutase|nr:phosphomannomutase/phosphoglucomutase [Synergistaceae bacterium]